MSVVLTIGVSDSSGRGGIQADLRVFQALGVHGTSALTAVEARGAGRARRQVKLPARIIEAQIEAVARELDVAAVKIGPLLSWQTVEVVAARLRRLRLRNVVVHGEIFDSSGARILGARGVAGLRRSVLPRARVVVLSAAEAGLLAEMPVGSIEEAKAAAGRLREKGVEAVLISGLPARALWLAQDGAVQEFDWVDGDTGNVSAGFLSAAITARLALGDGVEGAIAFAAAHAGAEFLLPNPAGPADI